MRRGDLIKSTGFKTGVLYLSIFMVAAAIASAAAFLIIQQELVGRHRRAVAQDYAFFADLYRTGGEADLVETLQAYSKFVRDKDRIYVLRGPKGTHLAGNISLAGPLPASGETSATALGVDGDYDYLVQAGELGDLSLLVGTSAEDLSEVEEVFYQGALWAGLLLAVISLAGGIALSHRMNLRIAEIQGALEAISNGRFDVRIPKSGSGDDLDRLATLIDEAVISLGAAVETNRQISADIAHDLKTPMNRLRISVERALALNEAGSEVASEIDEIDKESRNILSTFDALLRIAQIEAGARKARFGPVEIGAVLSDVVEFYEAHVEEAGAVLNARIPYGMPSVEGDRELLAQLFANLIENALKHAGAAPRIDCSVAVEDKAVVVRIADNGPGIPPEEFDKVLRRLYRLQKSRTTPGSGLGLSLAKAIADLHGAKLRLGDNRPGLVVEIAFPASEDGAR